jgi:hypothetical protein
MFETKNIYTTLDDLSNYDKPIPDGFGGDSSNNYLKNKKKKKDEKYDKNDKKYVNKKLIRAWIKALEKSKIIYIFFR